MSSSLDQLKSSGTVVVCDSGDFASTFINTLGSED